MRYAKKSEICCSVVYLLAGKIYKQRKNIFILKALSFRKGCECISFSFNVFEIVISWHSIGWHSPSAWGRIIPKCTYYSFFHFNMFSYLLHACYPGTISSFQLTHLNVWVIHHLSPRKFSAYLLTFLERFSLGNFLPLSFDVSFSLPYAASYIKCRLLFIQRSLSFKIHTGNDDLQHQLPFSLINLRQCHLLPQHTIYRHPFQICLLLSFVLAYNFASYFLNILYNY